MVGPAPKQSMRETALPAIDPPRTTMAVVSAVHTLLRSAIEACAAGTERLSVLFSGGLDSSLIAWMLRSVPDVRLVTVGTPGSADLAAARGAAELLGRPWNPRVVSPPELEQARSRWRSEIGDSGRMEGVLLGLALALEASPTAVVLCGQGADELFLGYAHFEGRNTAAVRAVQRRDWARLVEADWPRATACALKLGKTLRSPYLDSNLSRFLFTVPVESLRTSPERKGLLRLVAAQEGLANTLVHRPKRAMQYGSGIDRALRTRGSGPKPGGP